MTKTRTIPNPASAVLRAAIVAAVTADPEEFRPTRHDMALMVLWVPATLLIGMSEANLARDLGLAGGNVPSGAAPNPESRLLRQAVVGGAGLGRPPEFHAPTGKAAVFLYVPIDAVLGRTLPELQQDLGLPWSDERGNPVWLDELLVT